MHMWASLEPNPGSKRGDSKVREETQEVHRGQDQRHLSGVKEEDRRGSQRRATVREEDRRVSRSNQTGRRDPGQLEETLGSTMLTQGQVMHKPQEHLEGGSSRDSNQVQHQDSNDSSREPRENNDSRAVLSRRFFMRLQLQEGRPKRPVPTRTCCSTAEEAEGCKRYG